MPHGTALVRRWLRPITVMMASLSAGSGPAGLAQPEPASGMLAVDDGRLYYEVAGDGDPVVFVHGGFGDRRMWDHTFAALAGRFRVVRYDHRGFGRSPAPQAPYSAAGDLLRLLDHLRLGPVHLVGNSMGGTLAIDFALLHPDRVRTLTVVSAGPGGFAVTESDAAGVIAVFEAARREGPPAAAALWLEHPMVHVTSRDSYAGPRLEEMVRENAKAFLMPVRQWPGETLAPPAIERLNTIRVPTLVIAGSEDTALVRTMARTTAEGVPGARLQMIAGADHLPQMVKPREFEAALRGFLDGR